MKILSKGILFLLVFFLCTINVFGDETSTELDGAIHVKMEKYSPKSENEYISFCLTKVGEISNGEYIFHTKYIKSKERYSIDTSALIIGEAVEEMLKQVDPEMEGVINEKGELVFDHLEDGVYLLYPKTKYEHMDIEPSLVSIPIYNEINGKMDFKVEVYPKYSLKTSHLEIVPKTGDEMQGETYILLGICSVMAIFALLLIKKKKIGLL